MNMLCDGRSEFTASRDAAMLHENFFTTFLSALLIYAEQALVFKPQVVTLQALIALYASRQLYRGSYS